MRYFHNIVGCSLLCFGITALFASRESGAQDAPPTNANIRLPETDSQWKATKNFVDAAPIPEYRHASAAAFEAFRDMKYGVRIHWGIYSDAGDDDPSWPFLNLSYAQKQAYNELYKTWNPTGFDAEKWMQLFEDSGFKMFAFTTKHHEGFSMYDTKTRVKQRMNWTAPNGAALENCDLAYSIMETPFHRDVVKELCDAAHRHGIKIDLYFSNPDWYDADFRPYCDSPITFPEALAHPERYGNASVAKRAHSVYATVAAPTPDEQARMMVRYRDQLTELLTNYGKIDMLGLDMWLGPKVWPQMRDTVLALRKLQPDVMLRARGIGNYGDYYTPERFVPAGKENTEMPWFVIYPLAKSFSYDPNPKDYKGGEWIVRSLVDTVAKGGNFMVAIGPDANGQFAPAALEDLKAAGEWLKVNGEGIYATRPREGQLWKEGKTIRFTRTKDQKTVYAFSLGWPGSTLTLKTVIPAAGSQVTLLGSNTPLHWSYNADAGTVIELPPAMQDDTKRPCKFAYGFKIQLSEGGGRSRSRLTR
jgi:alpha-L-fucosidase